MNISRNIKRMSLVVTILLVVLVTSVGIGAVSAQSVCSPATAISVPFTKDGAGTFCYQATSLCEYVNSWNMTTLSINGTNYTNVWVAASSVSPLNGVYTITYNGPYAWSHLEIAGTCSGGGPTNTPVPPTNTSPAPTNTSPAATATRTNTPAATATRTNTPAVTNTPVPPTNTSPAPTNTSPAPTATSGGTGSCSPVNADISAPFSKDGSGTFCWRSNNLGGYVNSWNLASLTINGMNATNVYVGYGSYPAQIGGYWYVSYNSSVAWGHFETAGTGGGPTNTPAASNTPAPTSTSPGPTNTPGPTSTPTRTPTAGPTPTNPPAGTHLSNPFSGANAYVNQTWGGSSRGYSVNTSVWMDTIDAVNGAGVYTMSLNDHMNAAEAQGRNFISIVVYNLPGRDCAALASNGLLPATEAGLTTYETEYIDPIAAVIAAHPSLRVVAIIEPDSLPNLVTNLSDPDCALVNSNTYYQRGITYALTKFHALSNAYTYIDIGHAGWLGWPSNFNPAITLISNVVKAANGGNCSTCTDGFADNTANTQVETETFLDANTNVGGNPVRSQHFFDWNDYIDESHFATAWKSAMQSAGLAAGSTNMVLDTSRNGWGGCGGGPYALQSCRPTATSTSTTLDTYVNESRIDRRPAKGDWCNQNGAGLGKLPLSAATAPYQAYLWIKPPAESDGSSSLIPIGPDNPDGKGFDQMCDPNYAGNSLNQNSNSNALPNAPVSGRWFQAQWDQLVANKYP